MELTVGASFVMISYLYLSSMSSPVSGKCYGKWAIQACFGGNGKRSDPNMESSLLQKLLMSSAQNLNTLKNENSAPTDEEDLNLSLFQYNDGAEGYQDAQEESYPLQVVRVRPEIRDFLKHLTSLKLNQDFRERDSLLI